MPPYICSPWWGSPHSLHPPGCGQVGQYISRAEELKALVTSSNKNLLQQRNPARELLKGIVCWVDPPSTLEGEGDTQWGFGLK